MRGFEANPEALIAKGNKIFDIYDSFIVEKNKVTNTTNNISNAWKDEASEKYINTIRSYDEDFAQLGKVLEKISDIIRRHGNRLLNTRNELEDIAGSI